MLIEEPGPVGEYFSGFRRIGIQDEADVRHGPDMGQQLSSVARGLKCWALECYAQEQSADPLSYSPHFAFHRSDPKITLRQAYRPPLNWLLLCRAKQTDGCVDGQLTHQGSTNFNNNTRRSSIPKWHTFSTLGPRIWSRTRFRPWVKSVEIC
jgi:hypothetical protein